jgi:hypothetical protein
MVSKPLKLCRVSLEHSKSLPLKVNGEAVRSVGILCCCFKGNLDQEEEF